MQHLPSGRVTALFTDIEGSTALLRRLGPRYDALLSEHFAILRRAIAANAGIEVDTAGDAIFAVFPDAADAVAAAVQAQRGLAAHPWPVDGALRVRMGLHTGDVRVHDGGYVGMTVHQAARVITVAHGGQIVCSSATAEAAQALLPGDIELIELGAWQLRDFDVPEALFQIAGVGLEQGFPALRAVPAAAHNLPQARTSFVGREHEVDELVKLVETEHVVTIVGPGGSGKTRIAFEIVRRLAPGFKDGATVVLLAPLTRPDQVVVRAAEALGVREEIGRPLAETVVAALARRRALIVLDNCEHVLEAAAVLAEAVLDRAEGVVLVATSRAPLGIAGEVVYPLDTLEVPAPGLLPEAALQVGSVALFVERARTANPRFTFDHETVEAVARICRHVDGLPLAIELAASRVRSMPLAILADRIEDTIGLLTTGGSTLDARQRTVTALIDWSYDLLGVDEQRLFARLTVFRGGFTFDAVEAVCGSVPLTRVKVADHLDALVRHSLVAMDTDGRYRMLVVIRDVAAEHLRAHGEQAALADEHLAFFAHLTDDISMALAGPDQVARVQRLDAEIDNLRAALEWGLRGAGDATRTHRMAGDLADYWIRRGLAAEGRAWAEEALREATGAERLAVLRAAGTLASAAADYTTSASRLEEAVTAARALGDRRGEGAALGELGSVARSRGDFATAAAHVDIALAIARETGDRVSEGLWLGSLGMLASVRMDHDNAIPFFEAALAIAREVGDRSREGLWLGGLGAVAWLRGQSDTATAHLGAALAIAIETSDPVREARWLGNLGGVAGSRGDYTMAAANCEAALVVAREIGDRRSEGVWLGNLGNVASSRGDFAAAATYAEAGVRVAREIGNRVEEGRCLGNLGNAALARGDHAGATANHEAALVIARAIADRSREGLWLGNLGGVAAALGDYRTSVTRYSAALEIAREMQDQLLESTWLTQLAHLAAVEGDDDRASALAVDALRLDRADPQGAHALLAFVAARRGDHPSAREEAANALRSIAAQADSMAALALLAAALGGEAAVTLGTAAITWSTAVGFVLPLPSAEWLGRALDDARIAVGNDRYETLRVEATELTPDAAAAVVLASLGTQ